MSLQNMNQMRLGPKKDYVANRLVSGALQLARNTSLFLDETQLEQGQLDATGEPVRNHKGTTLRVCSFPLQRDHIVGANRVGSFSVCVVRCT